LDEMRMKIAFTPFTLDESSAMHIQSVKCKFALRGWSWTLICYGLPVRQTQQHS